MAEIAAYKATRAVTKGQLTKLKNYANDKANTANIFELKAKLAMLETYYKKFDDAQTAIEQSDEKEITSDERDQFENDYCMTKAKLCGAIHKVEPRESLPNTSLNYTLPVPSTTREKFRLPRITLPIFNGEITKWLEFWNRFSKMVHDNSELDDMNKFEYLKDCLVGGKAESVLYSLDVTADNYKKAIDKLKLRYDNKRFLFQSHIKELYMCQDIGKNTTENLRNLIDKVTSHVESLLTIATKEQLFDGFLLHMVSQKLDANNRTRWEDEVTNISASTTNNTGNHHIYPTWDQFTRFAEVRCLTQENILTNFPHSNKPSGENSSKSSSKKHSFTTTSTSDAALCVFCKQVHNVFSCQKFTSLDQKARYDEVKKLNLCLNCLHPGHSSKKCHSTRTCQVCRHKHHTLLHFTSTQPQQQTASVNIPVPENNQAPVAHHANLTNFNTTLSRLQSFEDQHTNQVSLSNSHSRLPLSHPMQTPIQPTSPDVILSTAIVTVKNIYGHQIPCRTLLDGGSQLNFMTRRLVNILGIPVQQTDVDLSISGIANTQQTTNAKVHVIISSTVSTWSLQLEAYVLNTITSYQPSSKLNHHYIDVPSNVKLADPRLCSPQKIDLLIGNAHFLDLLLVGQIKINDLILQKTRLGWIMGGTVSQLQRNPVTSLPCSESSEDLSIENIDRILGNFWNVDDLTTQTTSSELSECEAHFQSTHQRLPCGKYMVRLPFKTTSFELGNSYDNALKCFLSIEKKLLKNQPLREQYTNFIDEYESLGHLEEVNSIPEDKIHYFLPHHPVLKTESSTTKLRVVFNASKKTSNGKSLNDLLMIGPTIQDDLFCILLRFRMHQFVLGADVTKMYRQIEVHEDDQWLQLILWRTSPSAPLRILKLKTVTYGTAPASFLAIRSLVQLAKDEQEDFPLAAKVVLQDFYVDNLLTGDDSMETLREIKSQVTAMTRLGNFPLRKWIANNDSLLEDISDDDREKCLQINNVSIIKTLGMAWYNLEDVFIFNYDSPSCQQKITKRSILSEVSKFFDPSGLISPVILTAKLFLQMLWQENLHWDESLPQSLHTQWINFRRELELLQDIRIPRHCRISNTVKSELHGFCDASLKAYAACIYLRTFDAFGNCNINLLCSKTRVAGLKPTTIARLELCGAHLLAELLSKVLDGMKSLSSGADMPTFLWTDSTIVLCWLRSDASTLKTFVSNRVAQVQALTIGSTWRYIPGTQNPADWASRGKGASHLQHDSLWFKGPPFLQAIDDDWPQFPKQLQLNDVPERKPVIHSLTAIVDSDLVLNQKFRNAYIRTLRVFCYVLRFINKFITRSKIKKGPITASEMRMTLLLVCKYLQQMYFSREYNLVIHNQQLDKNSSIKALAPFIDSMGVMRVGGRLENSDLAYDQQHQVLLPRDHAFTCALLEFLHITNHHCGEQAVVYNLRQQFWIISARRKARAVTRNCIRCFLAKPRVVSQLLGHLPRNRLIPTRAFTTSGVDFCGPFMIRPGRRGSKVVKQYVAIFVCFFSKAAHLEIVSDLTTDAFLSALKRFISRRGKPNKIYSDNATNFIGTRNVLKELYEKFTSEQHQEEVSNFCVNEFIEWSTIPPRSPHFGGLWEAAVKSAKHHMLRVFGSFSPIQEEFFTIICQIEAIMNSRPLSPMSNDPNDFEVLTPGHFLIGAPLNSYNEPDVSELKTSRLNHYQQLTQLQQLFQKRWRHEVLNWMQLRQKNTSQQENLQQGDLVLLVDDNTNSMHWPRGIVVKAYPSPTDQLVRVVDIRTPSSTNIMKRAVSKVCKLPMPSNDDVEWNTIQRGENV